MTTVIVKIQRILVSLSHWKSPCLVLESYFSWNQAPTSERTEFMEPNAMQGTCDEDELHRDRIDSNVTTEDDSWIWWVTETKIASKSTVPTKLISRWSWNRSSKGSELHKQGSIDWGSTASCLVSRVSCLVSRVSCLVSRVSCLVSRVSCLVSRVSCLVSRVSCLVSRVSVSPLPSPLYRPIDAVTRIARSARAFRRKRATASRREMLREDELDRELLVLERNPFYCKFPRFDMAGEWKRKSTRLI
jgi:hypothetical protein